MNLKTIIVKIATIFLPIVYCSNFYGQKPVSVIDKNKGSSFREFVFSDIGAETKTGTATINNNELKMVAGGSDIWGKHDEFLFGNKIINGDFDIRVQILNLSAANLYTKAGIMARADLSDSSQHVYFQIFPDNSSRNKNNGGCEFQYRMEKGNEMKAIYPDMTTAGHKFDVSFPDTWIRLKRRGDVFESYFSIDNKNWNLYSTFTLALPSELFVGLAVTSHNPDAYTTVQFASLQQK